MIDERLNRLSELIETVENLKGNVPKINDFLKKRGLRLIETEKISYIKKLELEIKGLSLELEKDGFIEKD